MFSTLRTRFGIPGVISVIALVFAMIGGAYAANNASSDGKATASAKAKKGPRGPKGPKGDTGPAGPQGPKGDTGAAGSNGSNGSDGQSVAGVPIAAGGACGAGVTGVKYTLGATSTNVCNGSNGKNGTNGTFSTEPLPEGETLTGVWSERLGPGVKELSGGPTLVPQGGAISISYPIRVNPAPAKVVVVGGMETFPAISFSPATGALEPPLSLEEAGALCPGSAAAPTATAGLLCIYPEVTEHAEVDAFGLVANPKLGISPDPTSGALFPVSSVGTSTGYINGSWAITAE